MLLFLNIPYSTDMYHRSAELRHTVGERSKQIMALKVGVLISGNDELDSVCSVEHIVTCGNLLGGAGDVNGKTGGAVERAVGYVESSA